MLSYLRKCFAIFDWIYSYLFKRTQSTQVNDVLSDSCIEEAYGVLRSSVLTLCFFCYNDVYINTLTNCYFYLHADDTILIQATDNSGELISLLEQQL